MRPGNAALSVTRWPPHRLRRHPATSQNPLILPRGDAVMKQLVLFAACLALAACADAVGPARMYPGNTRPDAEVVTLLPPAGEGSLVLYIDRVKTSNCTWRCSFHGPVQVLP